MIERQKFLRACRATAMLSLLSAIALSPQASAAIVETQEQHGPTNQAELGIRDSAGESNELEIRIGEAGADFEFQVRDYVAPLTAGPGCKALEAATVTCLLHRPGAGWSASLHLDLGGGKRNFFDASQLLLHPDLPITALGGPGEDVFVAGGGNDVLQPAGGQNAVYGNTGDDEIVAPTAADTGDYYDGGPGTDRLSYALRQQPVHLSGSAVAAAPGSDQMIAVEIVRGGGGNDTLVDGSSPSSSPSPIFAQLEGGPGDDLLEGGVAGGSLLGGPGNDILRGGDDFEVPAGLKGAPPHLTTHLIGEEGDDLAYGGEAADWIELGAGNDVAYGGGKKDRIDGGPGRDLLDGDEDADLVIGDRGFDRLFGGSGEDRLFAARRVAANDDHPLTSGRYDGRDQVGCGPDRDRASANPWDRARGCERVVLQPRPKHRRG